MDWKNKI